MNAMRKVVNNPLFRALLGAGGGNLGELDSALARVNEASKDLDAHWREVAANRYFTKRGWIYYDPMNSGSGYRVPLFSVDEDVTTKQL